MREEHTEVMFNTAHLASALLQQTADKQAYDLRATVSYLVLSESKVHRLSFEPRRVHPITAAGASRRKTASWSVRHALSTLLVAYNHVGT